MAISSTNSVPGMPSSTRKWPNPYRSFQGADGHTYYIVRDDGTGKGVANVTFLDYYSSLNKYAPSRENPGVSDPSGFFFVRKASSKDAPDHYGDDTVPAGWAMYIWDSSKFKVGINNSGWVKICQQGDVDWDIDDELKAKFVLKTVYDVDMQRISNRMTTFEKSLVIFTADLNSLRSRISSLESIAHTHYNKAVLDALSTKYGDLYFNNHPIGGNSYVYNNVWNDRIWWADPTKTGVVDAEVVPNSATIAAKLAETAIARVGLTLIVVEADGSLSLFKYYPIQKTVTKTGARNFQLIDENSDVNYDSRTIDGRTLFAVNVRTGNVSFPDDIWITDPITGQRRFPNPEEYHEYLVNKGFEIASDWTGVGYYYTVPFDEAKSGINSDHLPDLPDYYTYTLEEYTETIDTVDFKFAQTIVPGNMGLAEYVAVLPKAAASYVGRGYWVPLTDDGVHTVGHLHKCEFVDDAGEYQWIDAHSSGTTLSVPGSAIDFCWTESQTLWSVNRIHWTYPQDTVDANGKPIKWASTTIVRKFGSAPTSVVDGEQIITVTNRQLNDIWDPITDVVANSAPLGNVPAVPVYYRAFSTTMSGDTYQSTDAVCPTQPTWDFIKNLIRNGKAKLMFKPGDKICLPTHTTFGDIPCTILGVNKDAAGDETRVGLLVIPDYGLVEWDNWSGFGDGSGGDISTTAVAQWLDRTTGDGFLAGFEDQSVFLSVGAFSGSGSPWATGKVRVPGTSDWFWSDIPNKNQTQLLDRRGNRNWWLLPSKRTADNFPLSYFNAEGNVTGSCSVATTLVIRPIFFIG